MSDIKYNIFLELIKEKRINLNITQVELASILNKPQSYVSKYESGNRRLDLIEFLEVCESLKIEPNEFINELQDKINETK